MQASPKASRLLSLLLWSCCSWVRCLRGVLRRRIEHGEGATAQTWTPCVWCGISCRGHHFRGLSGVTLTSAPDGNQTTAALARSIALNHSLEVAAYFCHVQYACSSTVCSLFYCVFLFSFKLWFFIIKNPPIKVRNPTLQLNTIIILCLQLRKKYFQPNFFYYMVHIYSI